MGNPSYNTDKELPPKDPLAHYPTQFKLVAATIFSFIDLSKPARVMDPGAGNGIWGSIAKMMLPHTTEITGVEIRPECQKPIDFDGWYTGDYLRYETPITFNLIIGNPPYGNGKKPPLWEKMLLHSWPMLAPCGTLIFLLKTDVVNGSKRQESIWRNYPPFVQYPCNPRPSHRGGDSRKTNKNDLSLFVWKKLPSGKNAGIANEWCTSPWNWLKAWNRFCQVDPEISDLIQERYNPVWQKN